MKLLAVRGWARRCARGTRRPVDRSERVAGRLVCARCTLAILRASARLLAVFGIESLLPLASIRRGIITRRDAWKTRRAPRCLAVVACLLDTACGGVPCTP